MHDVGWDALMLLINILFPINELHEGSLRHQEFLLGMLEILMARVQISRILLSSENDREQVSFPNPELSISSNLHALNSNSQRSNIHLQLMLKCHAQRAAVQTQGSYPSLLYLHDSTTCSANSRSRTRNITNHRHSIADNV